MKRIITKSVRPAIIASIAPTLGFTLAFLIEAGLDLEVPKILSSIVNFLIAAFFAMVVFPKLLGSPIGKVDTGTFLKKMGLYLPKHSWRHVLTGVIFSLCTLSGMLVAALLTGKYQPNLSAISLEHLIFSLNPAIWEEFFFRGVLMILLLNKTKSFRTAALIQILLFGVMHIKGAGLWEAIDVLAVLILGAAFTYTAWKTRSLVAGIVFHYIHDALLFFVQVPGDTALTNLQNAVFYILLVLMIAVGTLIVKSLSRWLETPSDPPLYQATHQPLAESPRAIPA